MSKRILVLNGHPDPAGERLCAALADAYARGARKAGHQVERIDIGALDFPLIRSAHEFKSLDVPPDIAAAQKKVKDAQHLVIVHPLWLGAAPALMKAFFEQLFREGYTLAEPEAPLLSLLTGRSARLIVTMGMPAAAFRLLFGAYGMKAFERGVLWITGVRPVRHTFFGGVSEKAAKRIPGWLMKVESLGAAGA